MAQSAQQDLQSRIDSIWKTYDRDQSGFLDRQETWNFLSKPGNNLMLGSDLKQSDFDKVFMEIDMNKDGKISKEEMRQLIMRMQNKQF